MKKTKLKKIKEMCETKRRDNCNGCIFLKSYGCGARNLNKKDYPKRPDKWIIEEKVRGYKTKIKKNEFIREFCELCSDANHDFFCDHSNCFLIKDIRRIFEALKKKKDVPVVEVDWDRIPEWVGYVAMDRSGHWCGYDCKPFTNGKYDNSWDYKSKFCIIDPWAIKIIGALEWKKTLFKRPNKNKKKKEIPVEVDWDRIPKWYRYVAMDKSGGWYAYQDKPWLDILDIWSEIHFPIPVGPLVKTTRKPNWKKSLIKRPEKVGGKK